MGAGDGHDDPRRPADERLTGLLPDEVEVRLDVVESQRRRLYLVGGIAAFGSATIAAVLLLVDGVDLPWWVGWALLATTALFLVDAAMQERTLTSLTRTLVAQQRRGTELEATVGDLGALLRVLRRINAVLVPEEVYDVVVAGAVELLDADSGSIRLRVADLLTVASGAGDDAPTVGATVMLDDDPAVLVVTLGVDVTEEDPPRLALPITVGGRHVGVLEVRRRTGAAPFGPRSALLGRLFAEEAAGAVRNANRFDLARSRAEYLRNDQQQRSEDVADTVHDLRVPLAGVLAWAELLTQRFDRMDESQRDKAVRGVAEGARHLEELVQHVFEAATAEARAVHARDPVAVGPLVTRVAEAAGGEVGRVEVDVRGTPVVLGDAEGLRRILANLVGNAIEHGEPPIVVGVSSDGRSVRVTVRDSGPGVEPGRLAGLFDRQPSEDGSPRGRGLPIVASLVRAMDGRVAAAAPPDGGTLFTVTLPAADGSDGHG